MSDRQPWIRIGFLIDPEKMRIITHVALEIRWIIDNLKTCSHEKNARSYTATDGTDEEHKGVIVGSMRKETDVFNKYYNTLYLILI